MSSTYGGNGNTPTTSAYARVAIASSTNATPIAVTTSAPHGMTTGDTVVIEGHLVNTNANGRWGVTTTGANSFTLNGSVGNGVGATTGYAIDYAVMPQISIPSDGDGVTAASVNAAFQSLADKIPFLYERVGFQRFYQRYSTITLDDTFTSYSSTTNATTTNVNVSTTTGNGVTPIVVTTSGAHGYSTGDTIQITGVVGNTAANGTFVINVLSGTTFQLIGTTGNGAYVSGGACTRLWGNLTSMTSIVAFPAGIPTPVCNLGDVLDVTFVTTMTTNAAGALGLGLGWSAGGGGSYQFVPGSAVRIPASYSGPLILRGLVTVGGTLFPQNTSNGLVFNFSVMDQGNAGSPTLVNLLGHREVIVHHYRAN